MVFGSALNVAHLSTLTLIFSVLKTKWKISQKCRHFVMIESSVKVLVHLSEFWSTHTVAMTTIK